MAQKKRDGKRKSRNSRLGSRKLELGYYILVTDTEATERCYFEGLRDSLPDEVKDKIAIKVIETSTKNLIDECLKQITYQSQYVKPWIIFDRDRVKHFDKIINDAQNKGIKVGWSNPCFEIWMFAYFGKMPVIYESKKCCSDFAQLFKNKTGQKYAKSDAKLYDKLCTYGDENMAIQIANEKYNQCVRENKISPWEMISATTVYNLVKEIKSQVELMCD